MQALRDDYQLSLSLVDGPTEISNIRKCSGRAPLPSQPLYKLQDWLFSDTSAGADASMKIYSMMETAKASEFDPQKYLSFLLEHRPSAEMSDNELEQIASWGNLAQETCK